MAYITVLITGFIVLLVSGGSRFAIGLTLKPMAAEFDWSRSLLSLSVFVFLVVSSLAMYLAGRLADRISQSHILMSGLLISAVGVGLIGLAGAPWQAFLLYGFVFALGNGLTSIIPIGVLISRLFAGRIGFANAAAISGMGFGQLIMIAVLAVVLVSSGWRPVYFWLGVANLAMVPLVFLGIGNRLAKGPGMPAAASRPTRGPALDVAFSEARRTPTFRRMLIVYVICGFQDFFVATHVVAFAQDRGVDTLFAGNLLALMGLTGLLGVIAAGLWSDATDPVWPTIASFGLRLAVFALILFDQSTVSIAIFALCYGATFWVTAPLTAVFARDAFGLMHIGAVTGFVTMAHHMFGGLGAWVGGLLFDWFGDYQAGFVLMLVLSVAGIAFSVPLKRPREAAA